MSINQGKGVRFAVPHCARAQKQLPFGYCALGVIWKPKISQNFEKKFNLWTRSGMSERVSTLVMCVLDCQRIHIQPPQCTFL